jgi:crossover junction endodeoxyribonuclease RusA
MPTGANMLNFYLNWMPSINNYYVKTRNGVFLSKAGRHARQSGIELINQQLGDIETILHDIHLSVVCYPPNNRSYDIDNRLKPILDTLQDSRVIGNDSQVQQIAVYRGSVVTNGAIYIVIREAGFIIPNTAQGRALI